IHLILCSTTFVADAIRILDDTLGNQMSTFHKTGFHGMLDSIDCIKQSSKKIAIDHNQSSQQDKIVFSYKLQNFNSLIFQFSNCIL
ncbi:hypothetical protein ACJX0J_006512, partial [Zea mays]